MKHIWGWEMAYLAEYLPHSGAQDSNQVIKKETLSIISIHPHIPMGMYSCTAYMHTNTHTLTHGWGGADGETVLPSSR